MSNSPLYNELLTLGFNTATAPVGVDDVIYIKNQTDKVRKISISVTMGTPDILDNLTWQNPTLKRDPDIELGIRSCLAKGVIPITLQPVVLDNVAFESATSNITNLGSVLGYNDYTTTINPDNAISTVINHGIQGNRFTIHGLATDTFDLSTLGADAGDEVPVFEYNGLFWSARQIRNSLVYTATGKPVIPVYVKWDIPTTGLISQIPFTANEINGVFGVSAGNSPASIKINYAGFASGTRYDTQTLVLGYVCEHKHLQTSELLFVEPTISMITTTFADVVNSNQRYNDSVTYTNVSGDIVAGTATEIPNKTQAFLVAIIPPTAYAQIELLQWTNPNLQVLRIGLDTYTAQSLMEIIKPHTHDNDTDQVIPLWLPINAYGSTGSTIPVDIGWGGLTLNNDWSIEHRTLMNKVSYIDPLATPGGATALLVTDGPITITIDGVAKPYANLTELLSDNQDIRIVDGSILAQGGN